MDTRIAAVDARYVVTCKRVQIGIANSTFDFDAGPAAPHRAGDRSTGDGSVDRSIAGSARVSVAGAKSFAAWVAEFFRSAVWANGVCVSDAGVSVIPVCLRGVGFGCAF